MGGEGVLGVKEGEEEWKGEGGGEGSAKKKSSTIVPVNRGVYESQVLTSNSLFLLIAVF